MQTEITSPPHTRTSIPLIMVGEGETAVLRSINGGIGVNKRLAEMGLVPDTEITVIKNNRPGGVILQVKDSKLCLGKGIAYKIQVEIK
mgnify:CR=1 FL=1